MNIAVTLPSQLDDYTGAQRHLVLSLPVNTLTLAGVLDALESKFPGLRFRVVDEHQRIRRHIAMFVGETLVHDLTVPVPDGGRIQIVGALSGG